MSQRAESIGLLIPFRALSSSALLLLAFRKKLSQALLEFWLSWGLVRYVLRLGPNNRYSQDFR